MAYNFDDTNQRVAFLLDHFPQVQNNYTALVIVYWHIFDGINIDDNLFNEILEKGTSPETISRSKRKVYETQRLKEYLDMIEKSMKDKDKDEAPY